jgi:hypothetical protein
MQSLTEIDHTDETHGTDYKAALGEDGQKKMLDFGKGRKVWSQISLLNPAMSYAPKAWVDAELVFWAPKTAVASKPASAKRTGIKQPAANSAK